MPVGQENAAWQAQRPLRAQAAERAGLLTAGAVAAAAGFLARAAGSPFGPRARERAWARRLLILHGLAQLPPSVAALVRAALRCPTCAGVVTQSAALSVGRAGGHAASLQGQGVALLRVDANKERSSVLPVRTVRSRGPFGSQLVSSRAGI